MLCEADFQIQSFPSSDLRVDKSIKIEQVKMGNLVYESGCGSYNCIWYHDPQRDHSRPLEYICRHQDLNEYTLNTKH